MVTCPKESSRVQGWVRERVEVARSCEKSGDLVYRMQRVVCSVEIHSSHVSRSGEVIEKASLPGEG